VVSLVLPFQLQHRFKQKRQQHYNEYQMMQQWKRSHSIDEDDLGLDASAGALNTDDDADMNGDDNGHEEAQQQQQSEQSSHEQQQQAQQHAGSSHNSQQNGGES
jgi:Protein phosphatase inhibitor 2 (IPP-2)